MNDVRSRGSHHCSMTGFAFASTICISVLALGFEFLTSLTPVRLFITLASLVPTAVALDTGFADVVALLIYCQSALASTGWALNEYSNTQGTPAVQYLGNGI